jgi:hypothetical protein
VVNRNEVFLTFTRTKPGYRPVRMRDDYAIDPLVGELAERFVAAVRALNERLVWIENPHTLDRLVRSTVSYQLQWARRERHDEWPSAALWAAADGIQAELIEETTEPWPRRALDHPPGQRDILHAHVEIHGDVAHVSYRAADGTATALDPISLVGVPRGT